MWVVFFIVSTHLCDKNKVKKKLLYDIKINCDFSTDKVSDENFQPLDIHAYAKS